MTMQKRILTIQDISCVGRCSMTIALPVLSAWGHETAVLPTAVLSTHTGGFSRPVVHHLSGDLASIMAHWKKEGIRFDAILTGYLGSVEAVQCVSQNARELLMPDGILMVDPAMADHGKRYSGLSEAYARTMADLSARADILLPNSTEAAMLTGMPWKETLEPSDVDALLARMPNPRVVLTGVGEGPEETGVAVRDGDAIEYYSHRKLPGSYHGTGDLFAACFAGGFLAGLPLGAAAAFAGEVTACAIARTPGDSPRRMGIWFERALPLITHRVAAMEDYGVRTE